MDARENGAAMARAASVLSDTSRATMLLILLDGRAWTATELAAHAGIARSTASEHLHVLVDSGLVVERRAGRHRYLSLADSRAAALVESLSLSTAPSPPKPSLRGIAADRAFREARSCYDHLAGAAGVALLRTMEERELIGPETGLTPAGERWCVELGIELESAERSRRPLVRRCLDWTERRDHLAGSLGAAVFERFLVLGWLARGSVPRAVRVTEQGRAELDRRLGLFE